MKRKNLPRRYPLVSDRVRPLVWDMCGKEAFDAGRDGKENPFPDDKRCCDLWLDGQDIASEREINRSMARCESD